ncbi:putative P2Y purinoceptor 10 [Acipenser ruthenus]|uniref:putative P2Y purinoceptor 10 n=1 Tax=Acipenser ruthenus TaxID=7906 RepID=UPI002742537A|nr:putative P2Y purinoceptor 10 [Acipenser ruthenus]XP_058845262.1 putative P2Y purinoceptor 10 [Acipenser ruthenus]
MHNNTSLMNLPCPGENIAVEYTYTLYSTFYLIIFIPGLLGNSVALWVLCTFIKKKNKAVIFMMNLTLADLVHVFSLPLRIYYYINHDWPFGNTLCMLCFYLKYLNMYASIAFLVCISIQRCVFLINPFRAKNWKRRYDIGISIVLWLLVGAGCSPFILMRKNSTASNGCFKDLPTRKLSLKLSVTMMAFAELTGFVIPLVIIVTCSCWIIQSLKDSSVFKKDSDKSKALRMVLMCMLVFLLCFAPYHINFLFYLMTGQDIITNCPLRKAIRQFHPISLCLASLSCCLNPIMYYFLTTEFSQLSHRGSIMIRNRLMSRESGSSIRE